MSDASRDIFADRTAEGARMRQILSNEMDQTERNSFAYLWEYIARKEQLPPPCDWRVWMIMAGRGFGKTRAGAEWVRMIADANPDARILAGRSTGGDGGRRKRLAGHLPPRSQAGVRALAPQDPLRQRGAGPAVLGRRA
jgi:hypothetical protein